MFSDDRCDERIDAIVQTLTSPYPMKYRGKTARPVTGRLCAWQIRTVEVTPLVEPYNVNNVWWAHYKVDIELTVRIDSNTIVHRGTGHGLTFSFDKDSAQEDAIQKAEADALRHVLKAIEKVPG